ncbi:30S ribosome-binding factor RbfA [Actinomycetaceae bacterium MB13-C1-2]|nr:30S ribosome-binding factor RbfA [Actinomycetaceae bacterium MB13-C1-2]
MADEGRQRRISERIRTSVTDTLTRKVKDPRLGFLTITDVRVTGDLQHATVYYTVLGDEKDQRKTRRALESAKGLVRSEVGSALGLRLTPTITFQLDSLPESAASIEDALREAKARDESIAAAAAGKEYAGGQSPYREPREDEDEEDSEMTDNNKSQAEELEELDQAWSDWRDDSSSERPLDEVEANLEAPEKDNTQKQQFEADIKNSEDDVEPGGTAEI